MNRKKFAEIQIKRSVLKNIKKSGPVMKIKGQETEISQAGIGVDYSRLLLMPDSGELMFATAVGAKNALGYVRTDFVKACNNIWAGGGIPVMAQNAIVMPEADEKVLKGIVRELSAVAVEYGVAVSGGHTEIIPSCGEPVVTMTVVGVSLMCNVHKSEDSASPVEAGLKGKLIPDIRNVKPDMDIVMCGQTGILGTLLLYEEHKEKLLARYSEDYLRCVSCLKSHIAINVQAEIAMGHGMVYAHDISASGVYGALWEMAEGAGCGIRISHDNIPILQETIEICEFVDVNPYMIDGCGGLLVVCENGQELCNRLYKEGYEAAVIGKITEGHDRIIVHDDEERYLTPPR